MNKNTKIALGVIGGIAAAVGGYFLITRVIMKPKGGRKNDDGNLFDVDTTPSFTPTRGGSGGGSAAPFPTGSFPIKFGSIGQNVLELQKAINVPLKIANSPTIAEDGIFGNETATAVKKMTGSTKPANQIIVDQNKWQSIINLSKTLS